MKDTQSLSNCYMTLNLSFDSDIHSCKKAYKRSVNQWHPDKYIGDISAQQLAEEKLKEINIAYSQITEFYKNHGEMPAIVKIDSKSAEIGKNEQVFDVSSLYENLNSTRKKDRRHIKKYTGILLFSLFLILTYQVLSTNKPSTIDNSISRNTASTSLNQDKNYFSYGSSFNEVINIQGKPDFKVSKTWYYGNSWVLFQNGVVADLYVAKDYPLNFQSFNNSSFEKIKALPKIFEKGDSKSDVRIIQGKPLRESRNVWYYSISKVYFKNNKVISWFNSPLDPLRVEE